MAAVAAALLAVPATAAHAVPSGAPGAPAVTAPTTPSAARAHKPALAPDQQAMQQLDKIADEHAALGVFGDPSAPVVVLPAKTSSAKQAAVTAELPADTHSTVATSQFTKAALAALDHTITARKWAPEAATYSVATEYDAKSDKLRVRSDAPKAVLKKLSDAHPGQLVTSQSRMEPQNTRFADWSPFWGGDALIGAQGGAGCTGGFAIKSNQNGRDGLVTAAHCYQYFNNIYNRGYNGGAGNYVGQVTARDNKIDAEVIGGTDYAPLIYTGGYNISGSNARVFGKQPVYHGLRVCVSGAVSFNHCGHPISNGQFNICWGGTDVCINNNAGFVFEKGGTNFPAYNNGQQTQPGDSGAPIYVMDNTDTAAWIVGSNAGAYWDCCGTIHMVGVNLDYILGSFNSNLITTS
ncbi:hypothetical protein AB0945_13260 [Streptomyces sp. NPDC005474]|uniref:hypothetical protein n=1 Tax=Streptomyces sp. NPDC005474 TaxID=3154878 RepID=UPI0034512A8D